MQESINFWDARNSEGSMPIYSVPTDAKSYQIECANRLAKTSNQLVNQISPDFVRLSSLLRSSLFEDKA